MRLSNVALILPKLDTDTLLKPRPLNQRSIHVPVTRTVDRRQTETAERTRRRVSKEGRIGTSVTSDPRRIYQQRKAANRCVEQPGSRLKLLKCQRCVRR